jgi:hypothetical protein
MSLLAEVASRRSLEEIDEIPKKLIDQQREDEVRREREDEPSGADWGPDKDDEGDLDSGTVLDQISRELEAHQIMDGVRIHQCWNMLECLQ